MQADEHAVARDGQILLDEVRALFERQPIGRQRVLGRVRRGAAMRDEQLAGRRAGHRADRQQAIMSGMPR